MTPARKLTPQRQPQPQPQPAPAEGDWRARAACLGMDVEVFFDSGSESQALAVCAGCPVRRPCLDDATAAGEDGVRGGTTERQRARDAQLAGNLDRRRKSLAAHGKRARYLAGCHEPCCKAANARYRAERRRAGHAGDPAGV